MRIKEFETFKSDPLQQYAIAIAVLTFIWFCPLLLFEMTVQELALFFVALFPSALLLCYTYFKGNKTFDFFHPLNFTFLSLFFGTTMRTYYLITQYGTERHSFLLKGETPMFLTTAALAIAGGILCLVIGFSVKSKRLKLETVSRLFAHCEWNEKRLWITIVVLSVIGIAGTVIFFQKVGLTELTFSTFSGKRRVWEDQFTRISYVYERWMASMIKIAYYISFAYMAHTGKKFKTALGITTIFLGFFALLFPIMTSSRAQASYVFINSLVIWTYMRKFPVKVFLVGIICTLVLFNIMLLLRQKKVATQTELVSEISPGGVIETIVASGNGLGIAKSAHIFDRVPEKADHVWGLTFVTWVFAPIPRSYWPDKPSIAAGGLVKKEIFLDSNATWLGGGHPPAIIAELFWNFSWPGIFVGMFLLGRLIKFYYVSFLPYIRNNPNAILIYIALLINLTVIIIGTSFNQGFVTGVTNLISFVIPLYFINRVPKKSKQTGS